MTHDDIDCIRARARARSISAHAVSAARFVRAHMRSRLVRSIGDPMIGSATRDYVRSSCAGISQVRRPRGAAPT